MSHYLHIKVGLRHPRGLLLEAKGYHWYDWDPVDNYSKPRCALCNARDYPDAFPLSPPWPGLHEVCSSTTRVHEGFPHVVLSDDGQIVVPIKRARMLGDTTYSVPLCRHHGRPETEGWVDCMTGTIIDWLPERDPRLQHLVNLGTEALYALWTTARFLWYLLTRTITIGVYIGRLP